MSTYLGTCRVLTLLSYLSTPDARRRYCETRIWRARGDKHGECRSAALIYQCFLTGFRPSQRIRTLIDIMVQLTVIELCPRLLSDLHFVVSCRIARYKALTLLNRNMNTSKYTTPRLDRFVLCSSHGQHELLCGCFAICNAHRSQLLGHIWHIGSLALN